MTGPDPAFVQSLFDEMEKIPANAISPEDNMSSNIICAACWRKWIQNGDDWRAYRVEVVTVYNGSALCQDHFLAAAKEAMKKPSDV